VLVRPPTTIASFGSFSPHPHHTTRTAAGFCRWGAASFACARLLGVQCIVPSAARDHFDFASEAAPPSSSSAGSAPSKVSSTSHEAQSRPGREVLPLPVAQANHRHRRGYRARLRLAPHRNRKHRARDTEHQVVVESRWPHVFLSRGSAAEWRVPPDGKCAPKAHGLLQHRRAQSIGEFAASEKESGASRISWTARM